MEIKQKVVFEIKSPEQSEDLQRALFALGHCWCSGDKDVRHTNAKLIILEGPHGALAYADIGQVTEYVSAGCIQLDPTDVIEMVARMPKEDKYERK